MANETLRQCYKQLNSLLENDEPTEEGIRKGDENFLEEGPGILKKHMHEEGFFNGWEAIEPGEEEYTRNLLVGGGEPDEMAIIT